MSGKLSYLEPGSVRAELAARAESREILLASLAARFEVHLGMFHDAAGALLPPSEWTPTMWACVRRVKYDKAGKVSWLELIDPLAVTKLLVVAAGIGGTGTEAGRSHLDDLLNEFTGARDAVKLPAPVPVPAPACGAPVDVAVAPLGPRALRSARNRAAHAAKQRLAKSEKDDG